MKSIIIGAGTDLGVHIDGAHLGPVQLINDLKGFYKGDMIPVIQDESIIKSRNLSDRRKNEYEIDKYNTKLYNITKEKMQEGLFPIILGGDHSLAVATALADASINEDIGMIWIDAHGDYNTFETTITGNIHGLPLAAINGYKNHELRYFHQGKLIQASRTVIIGARSLDQEEKNNLKYSGVTVFTTENIKEKGVEEIMRQAFEIAGFKTKGIHVSFDLDVIDPDIAPGVSIPEFDGISEEEAMEINEYIINHINKLTAFEVVEFNPLRDRKRKTEQIAVNLIAQVVKTLENIENTKNTKKI